MSPAIDPSRTVGQLVAEQPARSRVFEQVRIDYCCGGKKPLREACRERGISPDLVVDMLRMADEAALAEGVVASSPDSLGLTELADHIEQTHHAYLRDELPRLEGLIEKVCHAHGAAQPSLRTVREAFRVLRDDLMSHMLKEERILFPLIRRLDSGEPESSEFHCGTIAAPVRQMEHEHRVAGDALAMIRSATDDYTPPPRACNTYLAMLDGLARLERDMHRHIHKEDSILFPKALRREETLRAAERL